MATKCSKMSTIRKQIVRQNAMNKYPDLTLEEAKRQPTDPASSDGYIDDSKQWSPKEKITIKTYIPESKDSQVTLSSDKINHDLQCQETQNQVQGLTAAPEESKNVEPSPTKIHSIDKEQLLNRCNKKLEYYGNILLRRRNKEKIYFHRGTSLKKNAFKQQYNKRVIRKKDSSDGVPVSSEVLTETSSLKDNKDVLTDEQKTTQKQNGHGFLDVSQDLKKSPRRISLDSASGDEGFVNGDAKRSLSLSSALNYIPEDGACAVPLPKPNDEKNSCSSTFQEKVDSFRSSKKSSGYGGSEELPEEECFSSVFETEPYLSKEPLSNGGGLLRELSEEMEEAQGLMSSSTNGQRTVEVKESSLPAHSCIWNFPNLKIDPLVRRRYKDGVNSDLRPSEPDGDLVKIITDNPQKPLPEIETILKSYDSFEGAYRYAEDVSEEIQPLRSYEDGDKDYDLLTGTFEEEHEEIQLLISDASEPTLACNGITRDDRQVNGCTDDVDAVDGARCLPQGAKSLFHCLERAIFCKNLGFSCEDLLCVKGQMHIIRLKDLIQKGRLQECNSKIFEFLWSHSKNCTERQCVVPLCDSFHKRPSLSLEEHIKLMTRQSLHSYTKELAVSTQNVLKNGSFIMLEDEGSDDYALWKTAEVEYSERMGDFCDFNILRVCMHYKQQSGVSDKGHVVVKKALHTGLNEKNVYLAIKKPSPYVVKNFWCSNLPDDTMLVCSVYHTDLTELSSLLYREHVTPDLYFAILRQAAQAAQYLHSLNVVYLSWKCSSLLFDEANQSVKLCNFSHAMVLEQGVVVTSTPNVKSSIDPCFAAPEVLCGEALGFYSDVWGLGCLLYEMLHKRKPYPDYCHRSPADIRRMVCLKEITPTYPEEQLGIFLGCWDLVSALRITTDGLLELLPESADVDR